MSNLFDVKKLLVYSVVFMVIAFIIWGPIRRSAVRLQDQHQGSWENHYEGFLHKRYVGDSYEIGIEDLPSSTKLIRCCRAANAGGHVLAKVRLDTKDVDELIHCLKSYTYGKTDVRIKISQNNRLYNEDNIGPLWFNPGSAHKFIAFAAFWDNSCCGAGCKALIDLDNPKHPIAYIQWDDD